MDVKHSAVLMCAARSLTRSLLFLQGGLDGGGTLQSRCHDNLSSGHGDDGWSALRCHGDSSTGFLDDLLQTVGGGGQSSSVFIQLPLHCALHLTTGGEVGTKLTLVFIPGLGKSLLAFVLN